MDMFSPLMHQEMRDGLQQLGEELLGHDGHSQETPYEPMTSSEVRIMKNSSLKEIIAKCLGLIRIKTLFEHEQILLEMQHTVFFFDLMHELMMNRM